MPKQFKYLFQRDFWGPRGEGGQSFSTEACDSLALSVCEVCHRFGVNVESGKIIVCGDRLKISLYLVAGGWEHNWEGTTTCSGHPSGRICARILRFLAHENEEFG